MEQVIGLIIGLLVGMVLLAVITLFFRWLWNTTVPDVFGASPVDFWQAFKIMLLSAMLFGGGTTVIERGHEVVPDEMEAEQTP